jgi:hypothetical protein
MNNHKIIKKLFVFLIVCHQCGPQQKNLQDKTKSLNTKILLITLYDQIRYYHNIYIEKENLLNEKNNSVKKILTTHFSQQTKSLQELEEINKDLQNLCKKLIDLHVERYEQECEKIKRKPTEEEIYHMLVNSIKNIDNPIYVLYIKEFIKKTKNLTIVPGTWGHSTLQDIMCSKTIWQLKLDSLEIQAEKIQNEMKEINRKKIDNEIIAKEINLKLEKKIEKTKYLQQHVSPIDSEMAAGFFLKKFLVNLSG